MTDKLTFSLNNLWQFNNFWLQQFLKERGYNMEHTSANSRAWLIRACGGELKAEPSLAQRVYDRLTLAEVK